jgi:hypothetical protein
MVFLPQPEKALRRLVGKMAVAAAGSVLEGKDWVGTPSAKGLRRGTHPFDGGDGGVAFVSEGVGASQGC